MPRLGQNPLKWTPVERKPERITVTTIVHIPEIAGFWSEALDVLKLCFASLYQHTSMPFDLMVLDNGSCPEVLDYLINCRASRTIQFLILSDYNLRKLGALNFLLASAPGEIVSYADSDVFFLPGWLEASLAVMEAFPEAGQVTALPSADKAFSYCDATYDAIQNDPSVSIERGPQLIPDHFVEAHRKSIGKSHEAYQQTIGERMDTRISRNGVSAYVSAQDFQFTIHRRVIEQVLPLQVRSPDEFYDPIYSPVLEAKLDELGYWRLSTSDYLIHHIGNKMPRSTNEVDWILEAETGLSGPETHSSQAQTRLGRKLFQNRYSRRLLKQMNALTYSLLYES